MSAGRASTRPPVVCCIAAGVRRAAGAETFRSAVIAALAAVNIVSGSAVIDFLLDFSLTKLVAGDERCGRALSFVRKVQPTDHLPVATSSTG